MYISQIFSDICSFFLDFSYFYKEIQHKAN